MTPTPNEPTTQLAIRFPTALVERVEAHVTRMRRASPGVNVTRADAIRALVIDALDLADEQEREAKAKTKATA